MCPICKTKFTDKNLRVKGYIQCSSCYCFSKEKMPNKKDLKNQLSTMMLKACFDKNKENERFDKADYQLNVIEKFTSIGTIYDIGTAGGFFLKKARDRGWRVFGNELSKRAIEWAKKNYDINIDHGHFEDLIIPDNYFDVVVLWNSLEHVINPDDTIKCCREILKDSGIIQIEVPLKNAEEMEKYSEPLHLTEFDELSLNLLLKNNGFAEIDKKCFVEKDRRYIDVIYRKI